MFDTKRCFKIILYDRAGDLVTVEHKRDYCCYEQIQSQSTTSTSSITMAASVEASGPQFYIEHNKKF